MVRQDDLEARELRVFDLLAERGLIRARAVGGRPGTPYGLDGLRLPVTVLPSLSGLLERLPLGGLVTERLERRFGRPTGRLLGFERALGPSVEIINARETFQPVSRLACALARRRPGIRVVVSVFETIPFRYDDNELSAAIKRTVNREADLFVANSPQAADALRTEGVPDERIRVIPPAIDTGLFRPGEPSRSVRAAWGVGPDDVVVLFAGRLLREKGLLELLVALRPLLEPRPDAGPVVLVLHGSGPEEPRLRRAATALGIAERVRFSPWVPTARMPDVYRAADLVVLPSLPTPYWEEQFGFNLAEALACGRPVVSTRSGAIPSTVGDAAVLVEPYHPAELTCAVDALVRAPQRREALGRDARRWATERFSPDTAGMALLDAFHESTRLPRRTAGRS